MKSLFFIWAAVIAGMIAMTSGCVVMPKDRYLLNLRIARTSGELQGYYLGYERGAHWCEEK